MTTQNHETKSTRNIHDNSAATASENLCFIDAAAAELHDAAQTLAFDFVEGVSLYHSFLLGAQRFRHTSLGILSLAILRRFTFHSHVSLAGTGLNCFGVVGRPFGWAA